MPLPLPRLDNRTWDELVAEGRALIPRYAPSWTDHNVHDPGISLIELFAWLVEADIYRLDRTPAADFRAFLRMVGVEPHPIQAAETVVSLNLEPAAGAVALPAGLQIGDAEATVIFQTSREVNISPARLAAARVGAAGSLIDRSTENRTAGLRYQPFGSRPAHGDALYLGFDQPLAGAPAEISLYVWAGSPAADRATRDLLIAEWQSIRDEAALVCPPGVEPDVPEWWQHYSARTTWEYSAPSGVWATLAGVTDETRGLTLSGPVRFTAPADHVPDGELYFIRCRLVSGSYECPPEIDAIALNAVAVRHAADIEDQDRLGASDGRAGQLFQTRRRPIIPGSTRLRVLLSGGAPDAPWREALVWDRAGPHDRAYRLSPEQGEIAFGDGRGGRVPPAGAEIWANYQVGGGAAGNLAAACLTRPLDNAHNAALTPGWPAILAALHVAQPFEATGGAPAETLASAKGRAVAALAQRGRAITLADFESLALATPGVPVARARALADYHPTVPCFPALGCVTVVIVPRCPDPSPTPGPDLLRAVARYLDRRRPLTTEIHVVGPCYTAVAVYARLHVEPRTDAPALIEQARQALDAFFHPLSGGPDGAGWPVGRDVYRAEVMALLSKLPGVTAVDQLGLRTDGDPEPRCGNLPICPDCLVAAGQHQIQVIERSAAR